MYQNLVVHLITAVLAVLLPILPVKAEEHFPRPAELQPAVDFWVKVYTEVDTKSGYVHDADEVGIIYETLILPGEYYADRKAMRAATRRYAAILRKLAADRSNPTPEEQRILDLWGSEVSGKRLLEAARSVRFQRGQSDRFKAGLVRSGQWNDYIESVLKSRSLPLELSILPHVESSFNPEAYSKVGAAGIWQFTRATGRRYLDVDYVIDERMDPFAATEAAAQLLEHNYQLTGTWPLALTAYNHGAAARPGSWAPPTSPRSSATTTATASVLPRATSVPPFSPPWKCTTTARPTSARWRWQRQCPTGK